jgi:hypothetical protein
MDFFEYLKTIIPQAEIRCVGCEKLLAFSDAIARGKDFYCSEECADKALAILVKPQPKGMQIEGWDV